MQISNKSAFTTNFQCNASHIGTFTSFAGKVPVNEIRVNQSRGTGADHDETNNPNPA